MAKDTFFEKKRLLNFRGKIMDLSKPRVMGILNITPDSFYDGGLYQNRDAIKKRVNEMLTAGASIIDVGACSSRPGADSVSEEEEIARLSTALELIRKSFPEAVISVDTFRSGVALRAVKDFEADMINDISAGMLDERMPETIAGLQVPYLMMHLRGAPQTMQQQTDYEDLLAELIRYFSERTALMRDLGVHDLLIDPGFGFSKTLEQNYHLLAHLDTFDIFELPLVVGLSRKSMIYRLLDTRPEDALNGTTALHMKALEMGADILRVHDVKEAMETVRLFWELKRNE
ncbi:MAG: dihydropteroate synthase [Bacteroidales bacterium]|nr:dihydropteroate synthase [Bacteroidales bacterium]